MFNRLAIFIALSTLAAPALAQGDNGFLRGEGKLDLVFSYHFDDFPEVRDLGGGDRAAGNVERELWNVYAAYGLTDSIDLNMNASYALAAGDEALGASDQEDYQDLYLSLKWRIWEQHPETHSGLSLLFRPGVKLPLADYEVYGFTSLGSGQIDLQGHIVAHYQPARGGWFGAIETGYDRRNGAPPDEVPLHFSAGANIAGGTWVTLFYSRFDRLGEVDGLSGGFSGSGDFQRYGISLYQPLHRNFGLAGNYRISDDDRPGGDIDGYSIGIVARF